MTVVEGKWNKLALCKGIYTISDNETIDLTCNRLIGFETLLAKGKFSSNVLFCSYEEYSVHK